MKKNKVFLLIGLMGLLLSCETNDQKMNKAKDIVLSFVTNLSFENYDEVFKIYPSFVKVNSYWLLNDFSIKNTMLNENKVIITGSTNEREVLFEVEKIDEKYIITKSKGLSSYLNSNLYEYCKKIGCIGTKSYDADIAAICKEKELDFKKLVQKIKVNIEDNVQMINHTIEKNYDWLNGDITIKNNSRFTIPGLSYNLNINYTDNNGKLLLTSKGNTYSTVYFGQSLSMRVFESNTTSFKKVNVYLKIINTDFIEQIIVKNAEGSNCTYSDNI